MTSKLYQAGIPINPYDNPIINGGFEVWERGASFSVATPATTATADTWKVSVSGTGVVSVLKSSDVPSGVPLKESLHIDVTTAVGTPGATDYVFITHNIEGYRFRPISMQPFTLSFWVISPKSGIHSVSFRNGGAADRSYVAEYIVNAANVWEYKTISVPVIPAGTWDYINGAGLAIFFTLVNGNPTLTTPAPNSWQNGNYIWSSNNVNLMDNVANNFKITGLRLVPGLYAAPYVSRKLPEELLLAQRYAEVLQGVNIADRHAVGIGISAISAEVWLPWKMQKRAIPTIDFGTVGNWSIYSAASGTMVCTALTTNKPSIRGSGILASIPGPLNSGEAILFIGTNASAKLVASADL